MEIEKLDEISNVAQTILEIIAQQQDVHILLVKGQLQEMSKITDQKFNLSEFDEAIQLLENTNLIERLKFKKDTFIITSEGKEHL